MREACINLWNSLVCRSNSSTRVSISCRRLSGQSWPSWSAIVWTTRRPLDLHVAASFENSTVSSHQVLVSYLFYFRCSSLHTFWSSSPNKTLMTTNYHDSGFFFCFLDRLCYTSHNWTSHTQPSVSSIESRSTGPDIVWGETPTVHLPAGKGTHETT